MNELLRLKSGYTEAYLFSRNAPEGSYERYLLDRLVEAKENLKRIPFYKIGDRNKAKRALEEILKEVSEAHQEFINRGKLYTTPEGTPISNP